jgi:hypothetical protein
MVSRERCQQTFLPWAVIFLLGSLMASACASSRGARNPNVSAPPRDLDSPPSAHGTQRIYRARYEGARGGGSFKLTLRLNDAERFRLDASDPFGRALWTLEVEGPLGSWRDARAGTSCALSERIELRDFPLPSLALAALPRLLLGQVPFDARDEAPPKPLDGAWSMTTWEGRQLRARFAAGELAAWTLEEGGTPFAAYRVERGESILSGLASGAQLRWRESVVEPLVEPLPPFEPALGGACAATTIAVPSDESP